MANKINKIIGNGITTCVIIFFFSFSSSSAVRCVCLLIFVTQMSLFLGWSFFSIVHAFSLSNAQCCRIREMTRPFCSFTRTGRGPCADRDTPLDPFVMYAMRERNICKYVYSEQASHHISIRSPPHRTSSASADTDWLHCRAVHWANLKFHKICRKR